MNGHPGGEEHTRRMLSLAALPSGASVLDLGAGAGESVTLLRGLGYAAEGIDLAPRSPLVKEDNLLHTAFQDGCFDAVLSQCAFFLSGDVKGALTESHRLLKQGGVLMLSDLFFDPPQPLLEASGFRLICAEDMTATWLDYYLEALWRDGAPCCAAPRGASSYWLLIGRRE